MKRVIDGKTYNTDTSTVVARYEYEDDKGYEVEATVYQTKGGAFFIVHEWQTGRRTPSGDWETIAKCDVEATSREELERMINRGDNLEIIDERALSLPPEAEEEPEPVATAYLRLPPALKNRIEVAAAEAGVSLNAWAIRCFEACCDRDKTVKIASAVASANLDLTRHGGD